jgi:hypothetical protein
VSLALQLSATLLLSEASLVRGLRPFRWATTLWDVQRVTHQRGKSLFGGLLVLLLASSRARDHANAAGRIQSRRQSSA